MNAPAPALRDTFGRPLRPAAANKSIGPNIPLELAGTVKTYRYLDEDEAKEQEKNAAAAAPAGQGGR